MYLLDTDHVVILQQQIVPEYDQLMQRILARDPGLFFVSIVSFHEQVMGWNAYISRAKSQDGVVRGYERLQRLLSNFADAQVLGFDDTAAEIFSEMRKHRVRIGVMDLRISAIALSQDMTVLSRNLADFRKVPGLSVQDWTGPMAAQP
ncbi:MAG: type II toxin-antitoxin system VapC family toxin [Planctomycetes bacterium]|nr:type II toxin-antitoxin system VapC family toxin [Planctomycetota bacterium]